MIKIEKSSYELDILRVKAALKRKGYIYWQAMDNNSDE